MKFSIINLSNPLHAADMFLYDALAACSVHIVFELVHLHRVVTVIDAFPV
jgi:hypothetical protein